MGLKYNAHSLIWFVAFVGSRVALIVVASAGKGKHYHHHHRSSVPKYYPAFFIFGDSLSDTGNNNNLVTLAKATRPPYGRDSPQQIPTGRFSNGLLGPDFVAEFTGLPPPPPYLSGGDDYLQGVSFASSGSGILNSSGNVFGQHVPLRQQMVYFRKVRSALQAKLGEGGVRNFFAKALFYINIGSNDYIVNYLLTTGGVPSLLQTQYSPPQFVGLLQSNLELHIRELYGMGARKVAVVGLSLLGCVPFQLMLQGSKTGACIDSINQLTRDYNAALLRRLQALQAAYADAHFTYLSTYNLVDSIVKQPSAYGFKNTTFACCGSGRFNAWPTCSVRGLFKVCDDASKYVFWDFVHPTTAVNKLAAVKFWSGSFPDVSPYNLKQLALLS
ncbi:hypothetical protein L7F22_037095 [Adiantum nelumboides]|nr:hypothetical protein [Adiantum nelumboides]